MITETTQFCEDCGDDLLRVGARMPGFCPDCGKVLCADCLDIDARCLPCMRKQSADLCAASPERG